MASSEASQECRRQEHSADDLREGRRDTSCQHGAFDMNSGASIPKSKHHVHWGSSASLNSTAAKHSAADRCKASGSCSGDREEKRQVGKKQSGDVQDLRGDAMAEPLREGGRTDITLKGSNPVISSSSLHSRHAFLPSVDSDGNKSFIDGSDAKPGNTEKPQRDPRPSESFGVSAPLDSDSPLSSTSLNSASKHNAVTSAPRVEDSGLGSCGAALSSVDRFQRGTSANSEGRVPQRVGARGATQQAPVSVQPATVASEVSVGGGKQVKRLSPNQWVAALFKPTGEFRLAKILSVRAFGETGSHLPDEVLQPAAARQSKHKSHSGSLKSEGGGTGSSCKAGKSSKVSGSNKGPHSGASDSVVVQREAHPGECEYYVHYRHTNRRLDCWLPFEDILPVNSQGNVLHPPVACQFKTSALSSAPESSACEAVAAIESTTSQHQRSSKRHLETEGGDVKRIRLKPSEEEAGGNDSAATESNSLSTPHTEFGFSNGDITRGSEENAIALWKSFASAGSSNEEQLKVLMFDPSLAFSDHDDEEHEGMDSATLAAHEEATRVKTIAKVFFGSHELEAWYFSPFPAEAQAEQLHICEFCLTFFVHASELQTHATRCTVRHPPGNEIYRDGHLSMFEVDGKSARVYSVDEAGCHLIGYFSKEKVSLQGYNLACYVLSLKEKKRGGPERPLSDLGRLSYMGWWTWRLLNLLSEPSWASRKRVSLHDLVRATAIRPQDIQRTLEEIGVLRYLQGHHVLLLHPDLIKIRLKEAGSGGIPVYPEKLHFTPYNQGPPQANEVMPVPTAEETGE